MIKVKAFTPEGIDFLRGKIDSHMIGMRKGLQGIPIGSEDLESIMALAFDDELVTDEQHSFEIDEQKTFKSSYDLGRYLCSQIGGRAVDEFDPRMWTWISIVYLRQLLNKNKDGRFLLSSSYRYVLDSMNRLRYYRHLVYMPCYLVSRLDEESYIFLHSPLHVSGEFLSQAQKDEILSNRNLVAMCRKHFFDDKKGKFAPGFTAKIQDPRSIQRLVQSIVPQLGVNFDLRYCDPDEIFSLLPKDYQQFSIR